ncbi:hypothetical protein P879_01810 [Paragonimus westermani]|uniref:Histone acetyltransferase n=1 Tax=Paragonimus westermani TaxID=34504 RepID=A0A8T0D0K4_9TREM|nr:hypothetical protein P879_01810 [Paragonimus westermani]
MKNLTRGSKVRGRRKVVKSGQKIVSWARKQKQKTLAPNVGISLRVPLSCPLIGCLGNGHVNGIDLSHVTLSGCPSYHNLPFEKWAEMRAREDGLVSPVQLRLNHDVSPTTSPSKSAKLSHFVERSHQLRTATKEPVLDKLASPMELYQFRCAQQRLVADKEDEAKEHLILCARIATRMASDDSERDDPSETLHSTNGNWTRPHSGEHIGLAMEQRIRTVCLGDWHLQPIYSSAYPPDIACLPIIYVCEYCLTPMRYCVSNERHRQKCTWAFPPGDEIYRKDQLSFFEVDGEKYPDYCRNLCLLTKLFLQHKTVYEIDQVPTFLFYILTEVDDDGYHIIGYFSKQKPEDPHDTGLNSVIYNNLSCLLTLPQYQCQGYGRMLIEMSYILSLLENRIGSPERPLSDSGLILYRKYWKWEILTYLSSYVNKTINIRNMSQDLGIAIPDIVSTLLDMKMLAYFRTQYYIVNNKTEVDRLLRSMRTPDANRRIDRSCMCWTPHSVAPIHKPARAKSSSKNKANPSTEDAIS